MDRRKFLGLIGGTAAAMAVAPGAVFQEPIVAEAAIPLATAATLDSAAAMHTVYYNRIFMEYLYSHVNRAMLHGEGTYRAEWT